MGPVRSRVRQNLLLMATCLALGIMSIMTSGPAKADQDPPAAQARLVQQALLSAPQARAATGFTGTLANDELAGRSCYSSATAWTCDAWFTTNRYQHPYPSGVSITVAQDANSASAELARLAALEPDPNRPGSRVLRSDASTLIVLTTGFAVGIDLEPAVTVSVTKVQGRLLVMGTCQVQHKQLKLSRLRACATKLESAQAKAAPNM